MELAWLSCVLNLQPRVVNTHAEDDPDNKDDEDVYNDNPNEGNSTVIYV